MSFKSALLKYLVDRSVVEVLSLLSVEKRQWEEIGGGGGRVRVEGGGEKGGGRREQESDKKEKE